MNEELRDTLSALIDAKSMAANDAAHAVCNAALHRIAPALLDTLRTHEDRERVLREALEAIRDGNVPRVVHDAWRKDGLQSKHDLCPHGVEMYADCSNCTADYIGTVLAAPVSSSSPPGGVA
jgi:hypothetical protein